MKIQVTAEDVRLGVLSAIRGNSVRECAVARAIKRVFPTEDVAVGFLSFRINNKSGWLPDGVEKKISDIMGGFLISPFDFELPEVK